MFEALLLGGLLGDDGGLRDSVRHRLARRLVPSLWPNGRGGGRGRGGRSRQGRQLHSARLAEGLGRERALGLWLEEKLAVSHGG